MSAEFEFVFKLSVEELVIEDVLLVEPLGVLLLVKDAEEDRGTEELEMFADAAEILAVAMDETALDIAVEIELELTLGSTVTL